MYGKCSKFWTLFAWQKGIDKQGRPRLDCFWRSSLIRVFPICCSDKKFEFQPWKPTFYLRTETQKCSKFSNIYWYIIFYRIHHYVIEKQADGTFMIPAGKKFIGNYVWVFHTVNPLSPSGLTCHITYCSILLKLVPSVQAECMLHT